jgi:hypothetical protein
MKRIDYDLKKLRKRLLIKAYGFKYKHFKNNQYWIFKSKSGGFIGVSGNNNIKFINALRNYK